MFKVFSAARLRQSASFPRLTGVDVATFDLMLAQLTAPWTKVQVRKAKSGRPWALRDNLDEKRVASSRNAPERTGHCLTRMLPSPRHIVNRVTESSNSKCALAPFSE